MEQNQRSRRRGRRTADFPGDAATPAQQRRAMNQRRQQVAVQIRKQRKEETLRKRRRPVTAGAASESQVATDEALIRSLEAFLSQPDKRHLLTFGQELANASSRTAMTSHIDILQKLAEEEPSKASTVVSHVTLHLFKDQDEQARAAALSVLLDLSSLPSPPLDAEAFYGRPPARWSDLLANEPNLISALLSFIQHKTSLEETNTILGNLVQEAPRIVPSVVSRWPDLVAALPDTSFCCAAVIRQDATSHGMEFLQHLSTEAIRNLLVMTEQDGGVTDRSTAVEAAWMLEGLSRREDAGVDALCADSQLMQALLQRTNQAAQEAAANFLVPALRAVGNMATACDERYVPTFLDPSTQLVDTLVLLLEKRTVIDAVYVAGCFLWDVGAPGRADNASNRIAAPAFVPRLVSIVSSESATFEWKRAAISALWTATQGPPGSSDLENNLVATNYFVREGNGTSFLTACVDLLGRPDMDAVLATLHVLNRLLRTYPDCRLIFENMHGSVDSLERLCDQAELAQDANDVYAVEELAADLLDDFFSRDDEDDDDDQDDIRMQPVVQNNEFMFGGGDLLVPPAAGFNADPSVAGRGTGRGRGRTMPAWMAQE